MCRSGEQTAGPGAHPGSFREPRCPLRALTEDELHRSRPGADPTLTLPYGEARVAGAQRTDDRAAITNERTADADEDDRPHRFR